MSLDLGENLMLKINLRPFVHSLTFNSANKRTMYERPAANQLF